MNGFSKFPITHSLLNRGTQGGCGQDNPCEKNNGDKQMWFIAAEKHLAWLARWRGWGRGQCDASQTPRGATTENYDER
jgi:hypothetical protein